MSLLRSRAQGGGTDCKLCSQRVCSSVGLSLSWGTGGAERNSWVQLGCVHSPPNISKDTKSRGAEFGVQRRWSSVWSSLALVYRREPGQCHPEALSRERLAPVTGWQGGTHHLCLQKEADMRRDLTSHARTGPLPQQWLSFPPQGRGC